MRTRQFSLEEIIENVGGVETLAGYLEVEPNVIELALAAPDGARTQSVRAMVAENTQKLILMPSQGGRIWRITRKRVVKDWLILARWSEASGGQARAVDDPVADPGFQSHLDSLVDRVNELWPSPENPLLRDGEGAQSEQERALSKHVVRITTIGSVTEEIGPITPGSDPVPEELYVLMRIAAGGYLWRVAEREVTPEAPLPPAAEAAVSWMSEHPSEFDTDRADRLANALFWALSSYGSFALATEDALDHGFRCIAEWACDEEGVVTSQIRVGEEGMRSAFNAGVALREVAAYIE
jgi:hypothetical protein